MTNRDVWIILCSLISAGVNSISVSWKKQFQMPFLSSVLSTSFPMWELAAPESCSQPCHKDAISLAFYCGSLICKMGVTITWQGLLGHSCFKNLPGSLPSSNVRHHYLHKSFWIRSLILWESMLCLAAVPMTTKFAFQSHNKYAGSEFTNQFIHAQIISFYWWCPLVESYWQN